MDLQVRRKGDGVNITRDYQRLPKVTFSGKVRAGGDILVLASGAGSGLGTRENLSLYQNAVLRAVNPRVNRATPGPRGDEALNGFIVMHNRILSIGERPPHGGEHDIARIFQDVWRPET